MIKNPPVKKIAKQVIGDSRKVSSSVYTEMARRAHEYIKSIVAAAVPLLEARRMKTLTDGVTKEAIEKVGGPRGDPDVPRTLQLVLIRRIIEDAFGEASFRIARAAIESIEQSTVAYIREEIRYAHESLGETKTMLTETSFRKTE